MWRLSVGARRPVHRRCSEPAQRPSSRRAGSSGHRAKNSFKGLVSMGRPVRPFGRQIVDKGHRLGCDTLTATRVSQPLCGFRLHVHVSGGNAEVGGDVLRHQWNVRCHLRRLRDDRRIDIDDHPSGLVQLSRRGTQQRAAVGIAVARIRIRIVPADVPQPCSAEHGIGDRVQQHVGVGMTLEPAFERNLHAADDELAARHQRVHIETLPYPHPLLLLSTHGSTIVRHSGVAGHFPPRPREVRYPIPLPRSMSSASSRSAG